MLDTLLLTHLQQFFCPKLSRDAVLNSKNNFGCAQDENDWKFMVKERGMCDEDDKVDPER
jgi:hypothetical protein